MAFIFRMIINTFFVFPFLALAIVISFLTCLYSLPYLFFRSYALRIKMKPLVNHYIVCLSPLPRPHHQSYMLPVSPPFDQSFTCEAEARPAKPVILFSLYPEVLSISLIAFSQLILISFSMFLAFDTTKVYSIRQYTLRITYFSFYLG